MIPGHEIEVGGYFIAMKPGYVGWNALVMCVCELRVRMRAWTVGYLVDSGMYMKLVVA